MKLLVCIFILLLFSIAAHNATAVESVRAQEINQCLNGELITWSDGRDRPAASRQLKFSYNHAGAPEWFAESMVKEKVARAAAEWSQCGISGTVVECNSIKELLNGAINIRWNDKDSGGNFGLANLGKRTLSLGPKAFALLKSKNPAYDSRETLQLVISHEMGHFFGLMAHSKRCIDVLSYYDNGKGDKCYSRDPSQLRSVIEYRHILPTACDIERCRIINKVPPLPDGKLPKQFTRQ
jgi:hypothetical protein